jgi:DNA-binding FadR family transcriptional regulator
MQPMTDPSTAPGRLSRAERVANLFEDEMLEARLPIGAHLGRRAEFMARFAISPTIMNETLRILRTRGLISVRPGTGGGLFVASQPPQVRLGGMDLWFHQSAHHPLELFEARVHLESVLTNVAFERAGPVDLEAMGDRVGAMEQAADAKSFLEAVMDLHRVIAAASRVTVLDGMHQAIVATIRATLARAVFIAGHEEMLRHSVDVHAGIVSAIADQNRALFTKILRLHDQDLVRADDPHRSPHVDRPTEKEF